MIHTCTGLCKLFVNKLCSDSVFFIKKYNSGSVVGLLSAEVEEQRRACGGCIREHGPDTLVAEQNKNKHDLIRKQGRKELGRSVRDTEKYHSCCDTGKGDDRPLSEEEPNC
jgi:hypothetical protein